MFEMTPAPASQASMFGLDIDNQKLTLHRRLQGLDRHGPKTVVELDEKREYSPTRNTFETAVRSWVPASADVLVGDGVAITMSIVTHSKPTTLIVRPDLLEKALIKSFTPEQISTIKTLFTHSAAVFARRPRAHRHEMLASRGVGDHAPSVMGHKTRRCEDLIMQSEFRDIQWQQGLRIRSSYAPLVSILLMRGELIDALDVDHQIREQIENAYRPYNTDQSRDQYCRDSLHRRQSAVSQDPQATSIESLMSNFDLAGMC